VKREKGREKEANKCGEGEEDAVEGRGKKQKPKIEEIEWGKYKQSSCRRLRCYQ